MNDKKLDILADDIENESGRKLTNRQREFARYYVEGIYSNAECARKAGYADNSAGSIAGHLLAGKKFPHLVEYIQELRQERERRYGVTVIGQLKRLDELSHGAEDAGQFSAAEGEFKEVKDVSSGSELLDHVETKPTKELLSNED